MASSYTPAGIELIATGEQSGTWGATTNTNWELIEELATGLVSIALTGTTYSLSTTNGATSEGRHAIVKFTGSPGGACTVTVTPNDMQKIYWVVNSADEDVIISQGSGANVTVPSGQKKALYCDGAGSGAAVVDLFEDVAVKDLYLTGTLFLGGTQVTATAAELNVMDGNTAGTSTALADADRVVVNDNGTMVQVSLSDFETYFETALDTLSNVTTVGALDAGSITSNFGSIDTGSSDITTTGTVTSGTVNFGSLTDGTITVTAFVDEDNMSSDSDTLIPTQQSVKAYVDAQVATVDTLSEILANGNTSGSTDLVISASQKITTDTIEETTSSSGVTVGSTLKVDSISENTSSAGVTVGSTLKVDSISEKTSSSGVTVGSTLKVDTISENTSTNGVKIDGVRVKDNTVVIDAASGTDTAGTGVTIAGGQGTGTGAGGSIVFQTAAAAESSGSDVNALATAMTIDSSGNLLLGDNNIAAFGNDTNLQIYHDGTHSYIHDANTGQLRVKTNHFMLLSNSTGDVLLEATEGSSGSTVLYWNGTNRVTANSSGVDILGDIAVTGSVITTLLDVNDADGTDINGTDLVIQAGAPTGQGDAGKILFNVAPSSGISGDAVQSHQQIMEISDTGIDVTGDITVSGNIAVSGTVDGVDIQTLNGAALVDTDFATAGLMKTDGAGTYSVITDSSANWDTAYGWGDHSTQGYLTSGSAISAVVDDTSPQLGGDLDCNGNDIFVDADNFIYLGDANHSGSQPYYDARIFSDSSLKRVSLQTPSRLKTSTSEEQYDIFLRVGPTNIGSSVSASTTAGDIKLWAGWTLSGGDDDIVGGGIYLTAGDDKVDGSTTTEGASLNVKQDINLFAANAEQSSVDIDGRSVALWGGYATGGGTGGSIKFNTYDATGQTPGTSEYTVFETLGGEFKQTGEFYLYEGLNVTGTSTLDAVNVTGDVDITGEIKADSYNESYSVLGTTGSVTLDCEDGNTFLCDMTGNVTFTFSNPPASGTGYTMTIELIQDSTARTVTWPASVDWPGGTAPTISTTSGAVDVFVFTTRNGGTTWYGFTAGQAIA